MIHGTYDIKTGNFSLKAGRMKLFVMRRPRWHDSAKFGYKGNVCEMRLSGCVIVQVTNSFEHGRIELFY